MDRANTYTCETCRKMVTTVDRDKGVTPFQINCLATAFCKGAAYSSFYKPPDDAPAPTHEWFMPPEGDWPLYSSAMQDHFRQGGLDLRPIGGESLYTLAARPRA